MTMSIMRPKYIIAWKVQGDPISFGPGPNGEDQEAPVLDAENAVFDTLEEACEYLYSSKCLDKWEEAPPSIIKTSIP